MSVDVEEWRGGPHGDKKEATDASLTEGAVASLVVISKQLGRCVSMDVLQHSVPASFVRKRFTNDSPSRRAQISSSFPRGRACAGHSLSLIHI